MRLKSVLRTSTLGVAALFAMNIAMTGVSHAVTFVQTSDDCSTDKPCGITSDNKITVTADGSNTQISVTLASGWQFVHTGASGSGGDLTFGFINPSNLTFTTVTGGTPAQWTTTTPVGFQVLNGSGTLPTTSQSASSAMADASGKFSFTNGFGINCNGTGASGHCGGTLTFDVNVSLATFLADLATSGGSAFWADVQSGLAPNVGNTGIIDFTLQAVPLPPAALLFGSALVGLGFLTRRRRNQQSADPVRPDFLEDYPSSQGYTPL